MKAMIRKATEADAKLLSEMALRIYLDTFAAQNRPEDIEMHAAKSYTPEIQLAELRDASKTYLIAEVEGEAAGFAMVGTPESKLCNTCAAPIELFRFYVDKVWHGRGVAQTMMNAVDELARAMGGRTVCLGVWEHNDRAKRFYEKIGFRDIGSQPYVLGTDIQTDRVMVREIA
ncbi:MAG TPA: GNAT family N-acetyltransferase [Gemmatimonadaceae bacterium]|nr:GNAT family N-acetyltransferase [Gemmatimonadaceae bacterium]